MDMYLFITDISNIPEAVTPDMVSTNDMGSMLANYGDDSGDQCSLGEYLYKHPFSWCVFSTPTE